MTATLDFIRSDYWSTLFPLKTNLIVVENHEEALSKYIYEKVLADNAEEHFLPQQRAYATKPKGHLRRTVKLDPVAEYFLYDIVYRNRSIFRKQVSESRASFGYRFDGGMTVSINSSFRQFRKLVIEKRAMYKHHVRFDIASYFNSIYHHDLCHWFSSRGGVSSKDADAFGRFMREINAGRSVDFLPQGMYASKMIGNEFLKFIETSGQIKAAQTIRFMDDFYIFDDSESIISRDFVKIQQLLGGFALNVNPSKTAYDEAAADVTSTLSEIKKSLMEVVSIEDYIDTPSGVEVISEEIEIEKNLDASQVEILLGFLALDSLEESDADLILNILRSHSDSVLEYFPVLLRKFPNIYKHLYTLAAYTSDRNTLAAIIFEYLNEGDAFLEYQLFWLAVIVEETLSETPSFGPILVRIFELSGDFRIARAKVLEIPVQDFGLKEIRSDYLKTGSSEWLSWASAVGSRTLKAAERNYALDYFSKGSSLNSLVAGAVKCWTPPVEKKGLLGLLEKLGKKVQG